MFAACFQVVFAALLSCFRLAAICFSLVFALFPGLFRAGERRD